MCCSVITAITAQNSISVEDIFYLPPTQITAQINALAHDLAPQAIKLGMLVKQQTLDSLKEFLAN